MWTSSLAIPLLCKGSMRIACCMLLLWCTPVTGQEHGPKGRIKLVGRAPEKNCRQAQTGDPFCDMHVDLLNELIIRKVYS